MSDLCWVCEDARPDSSRRGAAGACSKCWHRLRKRFGNDCWESTAREFIARGDGGELLAWVPCRLCGKGRVSLAKSQSMLCPKCAGKVPLGSMSPADRKLYARIINKRRKQARRARQEAEDRRMAVLRAKMREALEPVPLTPRAKALLQARQDPGRNVIAVPMGEGDSFHYVYFTPFINAKGDIDVRPCPDHLKAP